MRKSYRINLDIGSPEPQNTNIAICQGDKGISLDIGITGIDTSDTTAKIVFHKRNGEVIEGALTKVGDRYQYTTLGNETSHPGAVVADVKIYEDENRYSTTKFLFTVDQDTMNSSPISSGAYSASLDDAIDRAIAAAELAEEAAEHATGGSGDMSKYIYDPNNKKADIYAHDTKDDTVSFTQASTLANIVTAENHATLFGKIMKWFSFIGTTALTTVAQTITGAINELKGIIGDKSTLTTTEKTDLVKAINEVNAKESSGGGGSGDMAKSVYDTANKNQDIFTYADTKVAKSSIANNLVTTADGLILDARQGKALQDQITTLNDNLTVKTGTITVESGINMQSYSIKKTGNIVEVSFTAWKTDTSAFTASQTNLFTLPTGYRPSVSKNFIAPCGTETYSALNKTGTVVVQTDGVVRYDSITTDVKKIAFSATFIV